MRARVRGVARRISARPLRTLLPLLVVLAAACGEGGEAGEASSRDLVRARSLGLAYLEENRLEEAEKQFARLVQMAPDEAMGHANLGVVHLRQGRYEQALERVERALALRPGDPGIRLTLAKIREGMGQEEAARRVLEGTLEEHPGHARTLYALAELQGAREDPEGRRQEARYLRRAVRSAPANSAARLALVVALLRNGAADSAAAHLEEFRQMVPAVPEEAEPSLRRALSSARAGEAEAALPAALTFLNFFRTTSTYQADLQEIKGPGEARAGVPVMTFSRPVAFGRREDAEIVDEIRFTEVTDSAGLAGVAAGSASRNPPLAVADLDGDQDLDLVAPGPGSDGTPTLRLLVNDVGRFSEARGRAGLPSSADGVTTVAVGDVDDDGRLDLFLGRRGPDRILRNAGEGRFSEASGAAGPGGPGAPGDAVFVDLDHDGDLDLFVTAPNGNRLYRNDGDGTFTERAGEAGLARPPGGGAVALLDFDDDGRTDLVAAGGGSGPVLFRSLGQSLFEDVAASKGLRGLEDASAVAVGDHDNDGYADLFFAAAPGDHALMGNRGDGSYERRESPVLERALAGLAGRDAAFLDFDNDGLLDLAVAGEPVSPAARGLVLFRNDGEAGFEDRSSLLPEVGAVRRLAAADYNEDGDLDLFLVDGEGRTRLLRNDGGNLNHYLRLQLVGLTTGSGKNNHFGIGAKVEVRAGELYQMRFADGPTTHLGLGTHLKADVIRIQWPNGVPQNLYFPGSDQDVVEEQTLKGSCAFLYAWNGEEHEFVTDVMWRSAIGMPVGIMGGPGEEERAYAPPGPSREYVRVDGRQLEARDGVYSVRITEELWETAYVDEVRLVAVDHPDSVDVFVDERFRPPGPPNRELFTPAERRAPVSAVDGRGRDVLGEIRHDDDVYAAGFDLGPYQGVAEPHELVLDLGPLPREGRVRLFLNGWVFPTDASINVAVSQSEAVGVEAPRLEVIGADGRWTTAIPELGFPAGKEKTVVADLTGLFPTDDHRVRIRTNMQVYWDHIFVSASGEGAPVRRTVLRPAEAELRERGFSRGFRKGGRHGPHWFDYGRVFERSPWRPITGYYTRLGDVLPLVGEADDRYVVMAPGDELALEFDAEGPAAPPPGWSRDFLLYTEGWIKDADLNTYTGGTVAPLPFHGMSEYPYGPGERFPRDAEHRRFVEEYLTRLVRPGRPELRAGLPPRPEPSP